MFFVEMSELVIVTKWWNIRETPLSSLTNRTMICFSVSSNNRRRGKYFNRVIDLRNSERKNKKNSGNSYRSREKGKREKRKRRVVKGNSAER